MPGDQNNTMNARIFVTLCTVLIFLVACAAGPPHFGRRYSVSQTFENYRILEGHNYYYNGYPYKTDALVAIRDGYTLTSPHWQPVDMDEQKLRRMVDDMLNNPGSEYNTEPNGAFIYNNNGEVIGQWYSVWRLPILTFISDTEFSISRPMTLFPYSNRDPEERGFLPFYRGY